MTDLPLPSKATLKALAAAGISAAGGAVLVMVANPGNLTNDEVKALVVSYRALEAGVGATVDAVAQAQRVAESGDDVGPALADAASKSAAAASEAKDFRTTFMELWANDLQLQEPPPPPPPTGDFAWEDAAFQDGGNYAWFTDPADPSAHERGDYNLLWSAGWNSDLVAEVPSSLSGRSILFNNVAAPWGERGPKWGLRSYNVQGDLHDLELIRCGDFEKGREGHAIYLNVLGDLNLDRVRAVQCGGQFCQLVWRATETKLGPSLWKQAEHVVRITDCEAIDCGSINFGSAVRASWPLAFYNPGQSLLVERFKVRTAFPPYRDASRGRDVQSHGALFVGPGAAGQRCPRVEVTDLDCEVTASDREEVRLWSADRALLLRPRIVDHGGTPTVAVVDDCGEVTIQEPTFDLQVELHHASAPYGAAYRVDHVAAGATWTWRPQ